MTTATDKIRSAERGSPRCLRTSGALRALALPGDPHGGLCHAAAALPVDDQPPQRLAAGVDLRVAGDRHDVRDPDGGHRPFGRVAPGVLRDRRRDRVEGERHGQLRCHGRRERRAFLGSGASGRCRPRPRRRVDPGNRDHQGQSAAVRGDARRHVGVSRRGPVAFRRRSDQRIRGELPVLGSGSHRHRADTGGDLHRFCGSGASRAALHAVRAPGLRGRAAIPRRRDSPA